MPWNNKDVFVNLGGNKRKSEEPYGILPNDFDNCIHQPTPEQEKEYLINTLDLDIDDLD